MCLCQPVGFFLDVGMYVPSRIFQASQQSVKLLSSLHQHDLDGKVSSASPRLSYPFSYSQSVLAGLQGEVLLFAEGEYAWVYLVQGAGDANHQHRSPFHQSHALYAEMNLPRDEDGNVDCKALVDQLRICPTLQEQADILYMLHILK